MNIESNNAITLVLFGFLIGELLLCQLETRYVLVLV